MDATGQFKLCTRRPIRFLEGDQLEHRQFEKHFGETSGTELTRCLRPIADACHPLT